MTREELGAFLQRERMRGKLFEIKLRGLELEQRFMETASPEEWREYVLYKKELEKRYNHNHDPKTGRFASKSGLTNAAASDNMYNSGAVSGALSPDSKRAEKHAEQYYESVRHMKTDTDKISRNTGISKDKIEKIKNHLFIKEHDLIDGKRRFDPSYDIAQSWQRLISGKQIEKDLVLLNHEYLELSLMEKGYTQDAAHIEASKKYNYASYCE